MRLTIPHYFDFGADRARFGAQPAKPAARVVVRDSTSPFGQAADPAIAARAKDIAALVSSLLAVDGVPALRLTRLGAQS